MLYTETDMFVSAAYKIINRQTEYLKLCDLEIGFLL